MITKYSALLVCALIGCITAQNDFNINELASQLPGNVTLPKNVTLPTAEDAQKLFKEKCIRQGGEQAFEHADKAKEALQTCLTSLVDVEELKAEMDLAKPTGDLDMVFKKYCRKSPLLKECITNFTLAVEPCLDDKERESKRIMQNVTTSLANFICFKEGDRIALFIAEGGPECLTSKQDDIQHCVNSTLSKYIPAELPTIDQLPKLLLQAEECQDILSLEHCIVKKLEECSEPTPANIVESLFKYVRTVTPCGNLKAGTPGPLTAVDPNARAQSGASQLYVMLTTLLVAVIAQLLM